MRSYQTARSLYSFLGVLAWCIIGIGALVAFGGGAATQAIGRNAGPIQFLLAAMPGLLICLVGTYGLAMVQMGRTGVDGAEYAQQALAVAREQLDISKQVLAQGKQQITSSYAAVTDTKLSAPKAGSEAEPTAGSSYANQPEPQYRATAPSVSSTLSIDPGTASKAPQIAQQSQPALPPVGGDIVYKDGAFIVGNQAFKTKAAALDHQKELLAIPRGE